MKLIGSLTAVMMMVSAASAVGQSAKTAHEFEFTSIEGASLPMETFKGKTVLVVNTASRCGFTHQYADLQSVWERYRERGLVVLGVPSNDFGGQEPGNDRQIGAFCRANYGVEFPMFSKVRVGGDDAHPVYAYLTSLPEPIGGPVQWNFQKYLVDRSGAVVARFDSRVRPDAPELVAEIERLLAEPRPGSESAGLSR